MAVKNAAKDMNVPPWELAGGTKLQWFLRWYKVEEQLAKKERSDKAKASGRRNR